MKEKLFDSDTLNYTLVYHQACWLLIQILKKVHPYNYLN